MRTIYEGSYSVGMQTRKAMDMLRDVIAIQVNMLEGRIDKKLGHEMIDYVVREKVKLWLAR